MRKAVIAAAPISMKLVTLEARRKTVWRLIAQAAKRGAKLICFPEYVDVQRTHEAVDLPDRPHRRLAVKFGKGPFIEMVQAAAAEHRIGVIVGQCAWVGRTLLNVTISVDTRGRILGSYAKTHLAPDEKPEGKIAAGKAIKPLPTVLGPAGILTCYEVLFPEIARTHHARGAKFLVVPTAGNSDQFFTLARARAAENYMPVVFSSYSAEPREKYNGCGAAIIDNAGAILSKTVHGTNVLSAEIDLEAPRGSPMWHGRGPKIDLRIDLWKRRRPKLYHRS